MLRFLAACCVFAALAFGQQTSATLTGAVTDPSGAVIPNVMVRVKNLATNVTRDAQTDATGVYTLPFLPAGDYQIAAERTGFRTQTVERVTLQVG